LYASLELLEKGSIEQKCEVISRSGDRQSVIVLFPRHGTTAFVFQNKGFVQVEGGFAHARVVTSVSMATTRARYGREECITATGIK
jgi:hypothetical protein